MNIKKILACALAFSMMTISASAAVVEFKIDDTKFTAENNGTVENKTIEAAPFIESGRTMVPVRAIAEAFGSNPVWNAEAREVIIKNEASEIKLYIDNKTAYVNGQSVTLDVSPKIVSGRTFVPLRFVSESLKYNVNYVNTTRQVVIDDTPIVASCGDKTVTLAEVKELYNIYKNTVKNDGSYSDSEFEEAIFMNLMQDLSRITMFSNAFSYFNTTQEEYALVKANIDGMKKQYTSPMEGLNSLVLEKYLLWDSNLVLDHIAKTENHEDIYKKNYVCAKHILVEDEKTANEVYNLTKTNKDFDALIKEYGKDPGVEKNPNGYIFTKGEMVEGFENAAFSLREGEISQPVKTDYGYHIIKRLPLPTEMPDNIKGGVASLAGAEKLENAEESKLNYSQEQLKGLLK